MPDPKAPAASAAKEPVAPTDTPPVAARAAAASVLAIDERFAELAAQLTGQVNATI